MTQTPRRFARKSLRRIATMIAVVAAFATPAITSAADPLVPGQVEITEIVRSSGKITLHWRITGPGGAATDVKYRIVNPDATEATFAVGSTASPVSITTDALGNPLVNGAEYTVQLSGSNGNGDGVPSTAFVVAPQAARPFPPRISTLTPGDQFIKVDFAQDFEGLDLLQYSTDNGATWSNFISITATSTTFNINALSADSSQVLTNGTSYTVRLRGWDTDGGGGTTGPSAAAVAAPSTVPAPVEITSLEARGNSILVNAELGLTGGSAVNKLEYSTDNGSNWTNILPLPAALLAPHAGPPAQANKLNVPGTPFSVTITNESGSSTRIAAGKSYTVLLRASNINGTGGVSNSAGADTVGANELSPAVIDSILARGAMLIVRGTLPTFQAGVSVLRVEYSTDNGGTWRNTGQKSASFNVSSSSASASTAITPGIDYQVRIRVVTTAGTSPASSAYPVRAGSVPAPPTITSAAASIDGIKIVGNLGADNGSPVVRIEYSTDNGSSWQVAPWNPGAAAGTTTTPSSTTTVPSSTTTVPASTTTTVAPGGTPATTARNFEFTVTASSVDGRTPIAVGTRYVIRVRAVSAVGVGAPSAARTATAARTAAAPVITGVKAETGRFEVESTLGASNGASVTDVEYSTDNGNTWSSTGQISGNFTITAPSENEGSALQANRFYEIRVRVVTANGTGAPSVPVTRKAVGRAHKITFPQPGPKLVGAAPFPVKVSANSKLPITLLSETPLVCTVVNSVVGAAIPVVTVKAAGKCTLTATRGPSGTYPAAAPVTRSFDVKTTPELAAGSPLRFRDVASLAGLKVPVKARISVTTSTPEICGVKKRTIVAKATGDCDAVVTVKPAKGKTATKKVTITIAG
jgi:hypothetical protein